MLSALSGKVLHDKGALRKEITSAEVKRNVEHPETQSLLRWTMIFLIPNRKDKIKKVFLLEMPTKIFQSFKMLQGKNQR